MNNKRSRARYFVQSHPLIVPSGSLEAEPSNEMLSVGKVITWSGPAIAIGDLLALLLPLPHSSQESSFLQEKNISATGTNNIRRRNIFFIANDLSFKTSTQIPNRREAQKVSHTSQSALFQQHKIYY
jgi:hypothetical protein